MDWFDDALRIIGENKEEKFGYSEIAAKYNVSYDTVRHRFRREAKLRGLSSPSELLGKHHKKPVVKSEENPHEVVLKLLNKESTLEYMSEVSGISKRVIEACIEDFIEEGMQITKLGNRYKLQKIILPEEYLHTKHWNGDNIIRFGVVSDTHLGSVYQQLTHLHTLYDIFQEEGITTVYNAGDITEGWGMRAGHEFECHPQAYGVSSQIDYVIEHYPKRKGITTDFILGNHDTSGIKRAGIVIGDLIAKSRPDMKYLGILNAKINLTPKCVLELNHPLDGSSYAISYSIQKYIDSMTGGKKPNILINGHHHKCSYLFYRNVHAIEAGTTQAQSSWMRGKRLAANVGGWIITVHVNDGGEVKRFCPEFIPFYNEIENDF